MTSSEPRLRHEGDKRQRTSCLLELFRWLQIAGFLWELQVWDPGKDKEVGKVREATRGAGGPGQRGELLSKELLALNHK